MEKIIDKVKRYPLLYVFYTILVGVIGNAIYDLIKGNQVLGVVRRLLGIVFNTVFNAIIIFLNYDIKVWWIIVVLTAFFVWLYITSRKCYFMRTIYRVHGGPFTRYNVKKDKGQTFNHGDIIRPTKKELECYPERFILMRYCDK